jgi:acyl transferase domain-containing protein/NAD(P)-dependent dehydrogenase (short-subunit alcohol dehydrogenase family)/acyl carrier protein
MSNKAQVEKIAVIGIGGVFPDAPETETFWENILNKKISIGPVKEEIFDRKVHFDPEVYGKSDKNDKSYTEIGSSTISLNFDGLKFRIPPTTSRHMDENQKVILLSVKEAMTMVDSSKWDRDKVSVFIGTSLGGPLHYSFLRRIYLERCMHYLKSSAEFLELPENKRQKIIKDIESEIKTGTITITEDTAPGVLPNITAARVATTFDFHGHAYTVDAACASSLAAIINGVQHLRSGESDVVICGGADMLNGELGRIYFSGINALSQTGSYPFDTRANGFVIGEGGGVVILKRLSDAVADGDNILCSIIGYGQNSDGKGKSIAAPNFKYQAKAIQQAIEMSAVPAETIELIEAHGTSTVVGDKSEIDALKLAFENAGVKERSFCAVGSAKSNIGHLKTAAGIAGLIKAVLAIKNRTLPPSANCEMVNPALGIDNSPFYINTETREWKEKSYPRRAGVSAFGFGGGNYHVLLEEFRKDHYVPAPSPRSEKEQDSFYTLWCSGRDTNCLNVNVKGALSKIIVNSAIQVEALTEANYIASVFDRHRLGICFDSVDDLKRKVELWFNASSNGNTAALKVKGIFYKDADPVSYENTAFLFPGQGSQYPDMLLNLQDAYPSIKQAAVPMDIFWKELTGQRIRDLINAAGRGKEQTDSLLKNTRNTHPAMMYSDLVMFKLLQDLGVNARYMVGHSLGEIIALAASGAVSTKNAIEMMDYRSRSFVEMNAGDNGKMIALRNDFNSVKNLIQESGCEVYPANINSTEQVIVSGTTKSIGAFCDYLNCKHIQFVELKVSHAFHCPVVKKASDMFSQYLDSVEFQKPCAVVYANEYCNAYPDGPSEIRNVLKKHIVAPVNYMGSIEALYANGVRVFIEVGPGMVLSKLTQSILGDKEYCVISTNSKDGNSVESIQKALAQMFVEGIPVRYLSPIYLQKGISIALKPPLIDVPKQSETVTVTSNAPLSMHNEKKLSMRNEHRIVYSGVSVGLPGSYKKSFQDDNFEQLFEGRNFIERLTDEEKERLVELNITKVEKTEQGPVFHLLDSLSNVVQLAGKLGKLDPLNDYGWEPKEIEQMSAAIMHGIAAGYEALRDAQIPLVRQYTKTSSGGFLPDRWALPKSMQKRTGVIYAHSFPLVETVIAEVSRHISYKFGDKVRNEIVSFYESLLPAVKDTQAKKLLTDWFTLNYKRLSGKPSQNEIFQFNHQFINQISCLANNRIAQYIQAQGPNFQLDAACSSTSTAITLAEEMIKSGRVDRMLIIASDDATSELSLPYLGAGFLSTGAATCESDLYNAAVPFDLRRNGMIMSSGAAALVVESLEKVEERGVIPVCELIGSHVFNTGSHPSRLDVPKYAEALDEFIGSIEMAHGVSRHEIASKLLYVSHETYTPARGGCSDAEAFSLQQTFGDDYRKIEVTNTKGMTGHTMGTSIEDVLAARSLQMGKIPPVVNYKVPDPKLQGLKLSRGGSHTCEYALRMAAGFGSQGNYLLLKKWKNGGAERIANSKKYQTWIDDVSGQNESRLEIVGRVLRVAESGAIVKKSVITAIVNKPVETITEKSSMSIVRNDIAHEVKIVISKITGYSIDMIEEDMEVESDLGIDTVKQATILSTLSELFGMTEKVDFKISAYPTVGHLITLFGSAGKAQSFTMKEPSDGKIVELQVAPEVVSEKEFSDAAQEVIRVISEVTGYPPEMIEADMEVESDLGIDTVKQATILSILSEKFGKTDSVDFKMSAYPTVGHLIKLFAPEINNTSLVGKKTADENILKNSTREVSVLTNATDASKEVIRVISEVTGYPPEMIEEDMEVESDLGIDTVKQATILSILSEQFGKTDNVDFKISAYPTVGHLIRLFNRENVSDQQEISGSTSTTVEQDVNNQPENVLKVQVNVIEFMQSELSNAIVDVSSLSLWILCDDKNACGSLLNHFKPLFRTVEIKHIGSVGDINDKADIWLDVGIFTAKIGTEKSGSDYQKNVHELLGSRFDFCKKSEEHLPQRILLYRTTTKNAWNNLLQGFYQSVAKEWNAHFSSIEVKLVETIDDYFPFAEKELKTKSDGIRIVYDNNERFVQKMVPSRLTDTIQGNNSGLGQSDVVLVTGGGNGITSRIVAEMASKIPTKYVILGRSELSNDDYTTDTWSAQNIDSRKEELKELITISGRRVTPVALDEALSKALKQRELQITLKKIREAGNEVIYMSCDITNFEQLTECVKKVNEMWGNVTGVIHGAGFEKSQHLSKKDKKEFFSVVDVKVIGALHLLELCPVEKLKLWVSMSSISGVFGNDGQTDYSSANAFLNGLTDDIATANSNVKSYTLAWSGWAELGMAWRNTFVRQNAQSMGLLLIPPSSGAATAVDVINGGVPRSVYVLHCGLGAMVTSDWQPKLLRDVPLLEKIEIIDNDTLRAFKTIATETDEWINQHRLEDVPLAPGVGMIEIMAETFSQTCQIEEGVKFEELHFKDAFKLYKNKPRLMCIEANSIFKNRQKLRVISEFSSKIIRNPEVREYCTSIVSSVNYKGPVFDQNQWCIKNPQKMFYEEVLRKLSTIKHNVAFGPLFHDAKRAGFISNVDFVEWDDDVIHTMFSFPMEQLTNGKYNLQKYIVNFCLMDSIHQTGVIHTILKSGNVHLPSSAHEFVVFGKQQNPGTYQTYAKLVNKTDQTFVYDIYMLDLENNVCAYALGSTYHRIQG